MSAQCTAMPMGDAVEGAVMKLRSRSPRQTDAPNGRHRSGALIAFYVSFVLQSFYSLAIRRGTPRPVRLP